MMRWNVRLLFRRISSSVSGSPQHLALQEDVALFGESAWVELPEQDD